METRRAKLQKEEARIDKVRQAITSEIATTEKRVATAHRAVAQALSDVICGADGFHALYQERALLFQRLRGIRKCLSYVRSQCFGQMPHDLSDRVDLIESYEFDRIGIPVDDQPVTTWAQAISELLEDPLKAALPGAG